MKSKASTSLRKFKAKKTLKERAKDTVKSVIVGGLVVIGIPIVIIATAALYITSNKE